LKICVDVEDIYVCYVRKNRVGQRGFSVTMLRLLMPQLRLQLVAQLVAQQNLLVEIEVPGRFL